MVTAAVAFASCTRGSEVPVPESPLQECVYCGDKTEFAVWSPDAEAAQLKLYHSAQDTLAFATFDMSKSEDGLWKVIVSEDIKGEFYAFRIMMGGKWLEETAGIAAKAVGVNGWRGAVIDWSETDPEGWSV